MKTGEKYLITTDNWFLAPDGKQYKGVWGSVEILSDSFLGIKTNARSSNWFVKVGTHKNHVILAGCQVHYAVRCDDCNASHVNTEDVNNGIVTPYTHKSFIYIAE